MISPSQVRLTGIWRTSPFRLTCLLGAASIIGIAVLLSLVYAGTAKELMHRTDEILHHQADRLLALPSQQLPDGVRAQLVSGIPNINYFALVSRSGETVVGNIRLHDMPMTQRAEYNMETGNGHGPLRILIAPTRDGETLILARDDRLIRNLRHRLLSLFLLLGGASMVAMAGFAILVSVRPIRRVQQLQTVARAIETGHYDDRMPVDGKGDELDQLAETVNIMVDEVSRLVGQVKEATDAVAHDLRAPLTRLKGRWHHARKAEPGNEALVALAGASIDELDLVLARFSALLRISAIEAGSTDYFHPVDLAVIAEGIRDFYSPLAEEAGLRLGFAPEPPVSVWAQGDRELLFEAIGNLVDNAIKFAKTMVRIELAEADGNVLLRVIDDGPGITAASRESVLLRFHRGPGAEGRPGAGLGLSIVAAIAHLHRARLSLDDAGPGLIVELGLPTAGYDAAHHAEER